MKASLLFLALFAAGAVQAQSTYRWVDEHGKVHYGDRPPPKAARDVKERKYAVPEANRTLSHAMRQAVENFPVTLYVTADCTTACKDGRDYLNRRGIPFEEKTVASNEEIIALRDRLGGGDVMVPVLQVGEKSSRGYLAAAWAGLLDAAGYPAAPAR